MLRSRHLLLPAALVAACGSLSFISAEDKPQASQPATEKQADKPASARPAAEQASPEKIADWIKQLDHDEHAVREKAERNLAGAGEAAIEPAAKAALEGSAETRSRAMQVLSRLLRSDVAAVKSKAGEALSRLSKSDDRSIAKRAEDLLRDQAAAETNGRDGRNSPLEWKIRRGTGGMRGFARGFAIAGPGTRSIKMDVRNGDRKVEVQEDGRTINIAQSREGAITMEVTEKGKDGEKKTKYEAKDAEELKTKQPDAYKLYEQYGGDGGAFGRIEIGGFGDVPRGLRIWSGREADKDAETREGLDPFDALIRDAFEEFDADGFGGDPLRRIREMQRRQRELMDELFRDVPRIDFPRIEDGDRSIIDRDVEEQFRDLRRRMLRDLEAPRDAIPPREEPPRKDDLRHKRA